MLFVLGLILLSTFISVIITYLISKKGWLLLSDHFETSQESSGETLKFVSMGIGTGVYKNSIFLTFSEQGLHLKTFYLSKIFHPPLFIPWNNITYNKEKNPLLFNRHELLIGNPVLTRFIVNDDTYKSFKNYI